MATRVAEKNRKTASPAPMQLVAQVDTSAIEAAAERLVSIADGKATTNDTLVIEVRDLANRVRILADTLRSLDVREGVAALARGVNELKTRMSALENRPDPKVIDTWTVVRDKKGRPIRVKGTAE